MADVAPMSELSIETLRRIEAICTRFEMGESNADRDIAALLEGTFGEQRDTLLCELAALDIELRRERGETRRPEDYLIHAGPDADHDRLVSRIGSLLTGNGEEQAGFPQSTRYQFFECVGSGGVSDVWRVFDRHGRRPLAVKILNHRFRDHPDARRRLEREALLTGSLQHPGIPPVYDHGELQDGRSFFAMKLVEGKTFESMLKDRAAEDHDLGPCLGIFEQVTQTLAYAHAQDIIHRDLKPQNVMVGRFGEVQVMDWGMAKRLSNSEQDEFDLAETTPGRVITETRTDPSTSDTAKRSADRSWKESGTSLTVAGDVLGTPCYMPPEQARGLVASLDQRSDVFGLGAMLFEILTRQRLYPQGTAEQILTQAASGDLGRSIKRLRETSTDRKLIELCERCLEVDPARRPANAGEVSDALAAYLSGVQERLQQAEFERREAVVHAAGEQKRRRTVTAMSAIIATVLILGVAGVGWQWRQAVTANQNANEAAQLADQRFQQAQTIVDEYLTEVANEDGVLARTPGTLELRQTLLTKARDYYEQFLAEAVNNPAVRYEAARAYARLGQITLILDPGSDQIFDMYDQAIEIYQELLEQQGDRPEYLTGIADAHNAIGNAYFAASRFEQSEQSYSQAAEVWTELVAVRGQPDDVLGLASTTHNIGHANSQMGRKPKAESFMVEALAMAQPLLASHGGDSEYLFHISNMYNNAGTFFGFKKGEWKRSLELYQKNVDLRTELVTLSPGQHRFENALAGGFNNIGLALYQMREIDQAREAFENAAEIRERLIRENPAIVQYAKELGNTYTNLGTFSAKQGLPDQSIGFFEKSASTFLRLADDHPKIILYLRHAVEALVSIAEVNPFGPKADDAMAQAIEVYERMLALRPESKTYAAKIAMYRALSPDQPAEPLLALTEAFTIENDPTAEQLAIRALILYRNGDLQSSADHLRAISPDSSDALVLLVATLVSAEMNEDAASEHLESSRKLVLKKRYPEYHHAVLLREAESRVEEMNERLWTSE